MHVPRTLRSVGVLLVMTFAVSGCAQQDAAPAGAKLDEVGVQRFTSRDASRRLTTERAAEPMAPAPPEAEPGTDSASVPAPSDLETYSAAPSGQGMVSEPSGGSGPPQFVELLVDPPSAPSSSPAPEFPAGDAPELPGASPAARTIPDFAPSTARPFAAPDKGFTRETVFFATDRKANGKAKAARDAFTTRRGELVFGACEVSVPKDHERGELESKKWYQWKEDPRKHILILEPLKTLDRREFVEQIRARLGRTTEREVLVFIHGYNVSFEDGVRRTAQLANDLEFPGAALCYSWPSGNGGIYTTDWTNAEWTVPHCADFLELVASQLGSTKIHLVAHSMGGRVLTFSLRELAVRWGSSRDKPLFHQIVLAAPDIDAEVFRTQIAPAIRRTGQRMTVYTSTKDKALQLSETINGYTRLGGGAAASNVFKTLPWLECVDATALLDDSWMGMRHSYYGDSPQLIQDMRKLLQGMKPPERGLVHAADGGYVVR